jgi:hypothetical protein
MEYFILNKNLKIPCLGYNFKENINSELIFYRNFNLITNNNIFIYLNFSNNFLKSNYKKNLFVAPFINTFEDLNTLDKNLKFIVIDYFNYDIIKFCYTNNLIPILLFDYQKFINDSKNFKFINFKLFNSNIIIKILIELGIVVISSEYINNFKFDLFIGDIVENLLIKS